MIWDADALATGAQFLLAATIAVHVLAVRPRAARENLALAARVIGDDVTLDQNHGLLPVSDAGVERVRQLVARVVHDPATAKSVLLATDAELAADAETTVDRIRIEAYLTRLADACARYQHDAWPLNGAAQRARHAVAPLETPLEELIEAPEVIDLVEIEPVETAIDLDDAAVTVERPAVTFPEHFDVDGRRITTRLRAQIDLTRLKEGSDQPPVS